jgi:hypothetical protein
MIRRTEFEIAGLRPPPGTTCGRILNGKSKDNDNPSYATPFKPMKPILQIRNRRDSIALAVPGSRTFPKTDFNYQATTLAEISGRGLHCCRFSFRAISQDYFAKEAPQHFAHEAVLFFVIMMAVALPLLNASIAVLELIRI